MKLPALYLISLVFVLGGESPSQNESPYFEFETIGDSEGIPEAYKAYIKSPVCEKDKCYEIEIKMEWDLLGRFKAFDTLSGKPLTKLDHIPFTEEDYHRLVRLLKDPDSPLGSYQKEELIRDTRISEIDGFTGATTREIKNIVVGGGVYSCYTLWHLAHRKFSDTIAKMTQTKIDHRLMKKWAQQQDPAVHYFVINHLDQEAFVEFREEIFRMMQSTKGYFAKTTIEKMPIEVFRDSIAQDYFSKSFETYDYFTQVALLRRFSSISLNRSFQQLLSNQMDQRNSLKNKLIQNLIR